MMVNQIRILVQLAPVRCLITITSTPEAREAKNRAHTGSAMIRQIQSREGGGGEGRGKREGRGRRGRERLA